MTRPAEGRPAEPGGRHGASTVPRGGWAPRGCGTVALPASECGTAPCCDARAPAHAAPAPQHVTPRYRMARFTADTTAFSDALTIDPFTPTPHSTVSSSAHSTYAAARASSPADIACSW